MALEMRAFKKSQFQAVRGYHLYGFICSTLILGDVSLLSESSVDKNSELTIAIGKLSQKKGPPRGSPKS